MVGAAGFEPTTCSTQNCRATRLRYTPNSSRPRRYTLQGPPARLAVFPLRRRFQTLFAAEQRMGDAVAGPDTVFLRRAGRHFQDGPGEAAGGDDLGRERLPILSDPQDAAVGADEDHVERD